MIREKEDGQGELKKTKKGKRKIGPTWISMWPRILGQN